MMETKDQWNQLRDKWKKGKRKLRGNEDVKSKKRKMKNVFSHETEELLSTCEDAFQDGKDAISEVYDKLKGVSCRENSFLENLKKKISSLKHYNHKEKIYIGFFGKTGAGKSSLINAIVEEKLLPSGSLHACTSVFVHVQANTEPSEYKAEIKFISAEADKLSKSIGCYIRSDKKHVKKSVEESDKKSDNASDEGKQFWPLVKRVTISLPKSPALLEGIVLVDLPGAGDVSKYRSDMWKECLSQCSSVWIVNEMNRALSEKVADEIFDTSLRTIAGGGECHNVTFITTKTDVINPEEIKENYDITDKDLEIESYKKFLLGDEDYSNEFFDVYTVSSEEFKKIAQEKSTVLDRNETELPALMEHIKKLYVSHFKKEVKDYVSEVSGIISYLHFSKDALSSKKQSSNDKEFDRLEKVLGKICETLNENLSQVHQKLKKELEMGAKTAETTCLKNATDRVLESRGSDNRGHHKTLKALCKNDGYYRSRKGVLVDLNYALSEPMYKTLNEGNHFQKIFGTGSSGTSFRKTRMTSIQAQFESFQENFITNDYLKVRMNNKEKYLRLVYIRTEQRKVLKKLEKEILQRKKLIYNSLSDSIRDTMKQTYQECSGITGKDSFRKIQGKLKSAIEDLKKSKMFQDAMTKMLEEFSDLQTGISRPEPLSPKSTDPCLPPRATLSQIYRPASPAQSRSLPNLQTGVSAPPCPEPLSPKSTDRRLRPPLPRAALSQIYRPASPAQSRSLPNLQTGVSGPPAQSRSLPNLQTGVSGPPAQSRSLPNLQTGVSGPPAQSRSLPNLQTGVSGPPAQSRSLPNLQTGVSGPPAQSRPQGTGGLKPERCCGAPT
ncbi:nuclear GTPase SLIP-GC-like [Conger conger]|uniref:nuclear GTPase SLIP-GC-like n=1 Tax=Conger conger TaxID=82655 RepID=UPI002A5AA5DE|nr:nuclear GTPase SLIP-GC-like [Conger conger]